MFLAKSSSLTSRSTLSSIVQDHSSTNEASDESLASIVRITLLPHTSNDEGPKFDPITFDLINNGPPVDVCRMSNQTPGSNSEQITYSNGKLRLRSRVISR